MATAEAPSYGTGTRLFHWATAGLVAIMIPVGAAMTSEGFDRWEAGLFIVHKGTGSILLLVLLLRLVWKLSHRDAPPFPDQMPPRQRRIARLTHYSLYGLLLLQATSGYVRTVGDGYPIELLDVLGIPPLIPAMPAVANTLSVVHKFNAYLLTALIAVHVAAVLHQVLIVRDGTLTRMWPPLRGGNRMKDSGHA